MTPGRRGGRRLSLRCALVLAFLLPYAAPARAEEAVRHELHVATEGSPHRLMVYDIDDGHRLLRSIPLTGLRGDLAGVAASPASDVLYISANEGAMHRGQLLAYHLDQRRILWTRTYTPGTDAVCVTPDGRRLYLSTGEERGSTQFFVLDRDGVVLKRLTVGTLPHNAICSTDSRRAYLTATQVRYLVQVDTGTDQIVRKIGPFGAGVRPFTINADETLAVANVNRLLGFEVLDMASGAVLHRVDVPGFPSTGARYVPSHGVAFTPDEREIWVTDGEHRYLHVFDATGLPALRPTKLASIPLERPPEWITFSLDGRFAYASPGEVISTATRAVVARTRRSAWLLEVDFSGGDAIRTASRHGLGYASA